MSEVSTQYVGLTSASAPERNATGRYPAFGVYHAPAGKVPKTALVATHPVLDFAKHYLAERMAARGIGFLGWNTRYSRDEKNFEVGHSLIDIGAGISWLRRQGVEKIGLIGNSGGGCLMAVYQAQASDPDTLKPERDCTLHAAVRDLPAADFYLSLFAHPGRPEILTKWMDAAVIDEMDPAATNPELDIFNPANGPAYSKEFVEHYQAEQIARNHRITDWCIEELDRIKKKGLWDVPFFVHRTSADPRVLDGSIDPSGDLPTAPASEKTIQARRTRNYGINGLSRVTSLRTWLGQFSLKESQLVGGPYLRSMSIPALVLVATRDLLIFPKDWQGIYDDIASEKTLVKFNTDHFAQAPDDMRDKVADAMADWLRERGG